MYKILYSFLPVRSYMYPIVHVCLQLGVPLCALRPLKYMHTLTHACCVNPCVLCFVFSALVRPVKVLKVWPELAPGQLSLLPLLSCVGPGGQVRVSRDTDSEDVACGSSGVDSCCHGNGALLDRCE